MQLCKIATHICSQWARTKVGAARELLLLIAPVPAKPHASTTLCRVSTQNRFSALKVNSDAKSEAKKPNAPPPITITDKSNTNISAKLSEMGIKHRLKITGIGTQIFVDDDKQFQALCNSLGENNVEFFTHPMNNTKLFKMLLYGLPEVPTEEITTFLKVQNNIRVTKIMIHDAHF